MNTKQTEKLELIRNAASAYGVNVEATSAPNTFSLWLGRNNGKTLYFKLNDKGETTHVRLESIYGLDYTRKQAVELLQEIIDLYLAEKEVAA